MRPRVDNIAEKWTSMIEPLFWRAATQADRRAFSFLVDGEQTEIDITYGELDRQARVLGAWLQKNIPATGRPILLLHPPGLEFITGFFGCLYGGMIAVPSFPPYTTRRNRTYYRLQGIFQKADPAAVFTTAALLPTVQQLVDELAGIDAPRVLATDFEREYAAGNSEQKNGHCPKFPEPEEWTPPLLSGASLAMLQFTSGSTDIPNGVKLSHGNLLHNLGQVRSRFDYSELTRGVSWLPPYHDLGLIGGVLQPLYAGFPATFLSPMHFLQQPRRWLQAISRTQATTSGAPNFAFDLCVQKITPEERMELDLSHWDVAFCGAEPVRAETLDRFVETFAPCGFRREAFNPGYGLAEATLMVTAGTKTKPPIVKHVRADALRDRKVVPTEGSTEFALGVVGCGHLGADHELIVVNPEHRHSCPPATVGEVWVRGPAVAQGYWNDDDETEKVFAGYLAESGDGPFLRTGDLGFLQDGELFVVGRLKELIILSGQNFFPVDIERTVEKCHTAIPIGGCAAFSVDTVDQECLVVLAEVKRAWWKDSSQPQQNDQTIVTAIRRAISEKHDIRAKVVLVKPATLCKTQNGKLQRRACREAYLAGTLARVKEESGKRI